MEKLFRLALLPHFNPRSRGGSDLTISYRFFYNNYFNPRSRGGSDQPQTSQEIVMPISIHAPAGGATA